MGDGDASKRASGARRDLREIKRRISRKLLEIPGVSGVGTHGGVLTIYLAEDRKELRQKVAAVLKSACPDVPFAFVVTGPFRAQ